MRAKLALDTDGIRVSATPLVLGNPTLTAAVQVWPVGLTDDDLPIYQIAIEIREDLPPDHQAETLRHLQAELFRLAEEGPGDRWSIDPDLSYTQAIWIHEE